MTYRLVVAITLLCSTGGVSGFEQASNSRPALEQALMASETSFIQAAKKQDIAFFRRTLADDFSFVDADGQLYDRQDLIDQRSDGWLDLQAYNMKVVSAGDSAAIVTYDAILGVPESEDQGPPPRYQHVSTVWAKQGDGWKMKFQQFTATHWGDW
jgi:ketosteroid isomerase-like protein